MRPSSFKRHRFPADVIRHAVWLYFRFTLSLRDVEEMMAQRGIEVSYETIRCWTIKFGPPFARALRKRRPAPSPRWHLDEMVATTAFHPKPTFAELQEQDVVVFLHDAAECIG
jgi:transposase-like protein